MQFGIAYFFAFVKEIRCQVTLGRGGAFEPECGQQWRVVIIVINAVSAAVRPRVPAVSNRQLPIVVDVVLEILSRLWNVRADVELLYIEPPRKCRCTGAVQLVMDLDLESECTGLPDRSQLVI